LTVRVAGSNITDFPFTVPENAQTLKLQIEQGIKAARALYSADIAEQQSKPVAQFDVLAHGACRIWILQDEQPWSNSEIAMQRLGEKLQDYRSHISIGRRKIFGLPLMPIIKDKRRSSPLLLRIAELQGNRYVGIAVLFKTAGSDVSMADYQLIEDWANEFRGKQEVML